MKVPFAVRRLSLLVHGARVDRGRPDLEGLAAIDDPMEFVWAVLPYAARTFATSILMLPAAKAPIAAVAYLYCRMLDVYEDLPQAADRDAALRGFAARMATMDPPPMLPEGASGVARYPTDELLVSRCDLVDRAFATLPMDDRDSIVRLVGAMADGMAWSSQRFAEQGGVLVDGQQLSRYCHGVMGEPALFTLALVVGGELTEAQRDDVLAASELIQIANITRDVERDLAHGIGYHPSLRPHVGSADAAGPVREARRSLMAAGLPRLPAYTRLARQVATGRFSLARASAILMLLHTDRHYAATARRVGEPGWRVSRRTGAMVLSAALAAVSTRWAGRVMRRVERHFAAAGMAIGSSLV